MNPDTGDVETSTVSFSSTPGYLSSVDDYYLSSNGIYVSETTNGFYNTSLYAEVPDTGTTLSWMRCMIATFTAKNGQEWTHTFGRFNSGTYNNQWMVVTLDAFVPGTGPSSPSQLRDGYVQAYRGVPACYQRPHGAVGGVQTVLGVGAAARPDRCARHDGDPSFRGVLGELQCAVLPQGLHHVGIREDVRNSASME